MKTKPDVISKGGWIPGRWSMARQYPHNCVNCGEDYRAHHPWPELPCPIRGWRLRVRNLRRKLAGWVAPAVFAVLFGLALWGLLELGFRRMEHRPKLQCWTGSSYVECSRVEVE